MAERTARRRLDQPAGSRRLPALGVDAERFARLAERLARFLGTGTFLLWQSVIVFIWIVLNIFMISLQWDPYPFILLNLAFSTQAAYAAPLILLAQNRQDDRDRISLEEDRSRAARTNAETEYLARELASMRLTLGEVVTRDFLRGELGDRLGDRSERDGHRGLSGATEKAIGKGVEKALGKALDRALGPSLDQALDQALDRALQRSRSGTTDTGPRPSNGRPHGED